MSVNNPYQLLGLKPGADADEIRAAYHREARRCHPDMAHDPEEAEALQARFLALREAYDAVLKLAGAKQAPVPNGMLGELPLETAKHLAEKLIRLNNPIGAIYQLQRTPARDADWHDLHGRALLLQSKFAEANAAFCEAYRLSGLDDHLRSAYNAAMLGAKSRSFAGRIGKYFRRKH